MEHITRTEALGCLALLAVVLAACISAPAASGDPTDGLATETVEDVLIVDTSSAVLTEFKPYYIACDVKIADHVLYRPLSLYLKDGASVTFGNWNSDVDLYLAKSIDGTTVEYYSGLCIRTYLTGIDFTVRASDGCLVLDDGSCIQEEESRYGISLSAPSGKSVGLFYPCGTDLGELTSDNCSARLLDGSLGLSNDKGSISLKGIRSETGLTVVMDGEGGNTVSGSVSKGRMIPREGTFRASGALDLTGTSSFEGWISGSLSDAKYIGREAVTGYDSLCAYGNVGGGHADDSARVHLRNATFSGLQLGSIEEMAAAEGATTSEGGNGISIGGTVMESMELESGSLFLDLCSTICVFGAPIGSPGSTAKLELGGIGCVQAHSTVISLDFVIGGDSEIYDRITVASGASLTLRDRLKFYEATLVIEESADLVVEEKSTLYGTIELAGRAFVAGCVDEFTLSPTAELTVTGKAYVELDGFKVPSGPKYNAALYFDDYPFVVTLTSLPQAIADGAKKIDVRGSVPQMGDLVIPMGVYVQSEESLSMGSLKVASGASLTVGTSGSGSLDVAGTADIGRGAVVDVKGGMSAADLAVNGTLAVGGDLSSDNVSAVGSVSVAGSMRPLTAPSGSSLGAEASSSLAVDGSLDVKGDLIGDMVTVNGSMDVGGDLDVKSIRVNGVLDVGGDMDVGTFVVEEGHDVDGNISADMMIVPAGVSFVSGWDLDVGDLLVLGTFRAELPFSADRVLVGMSMTSDDPYVGDSAVLIVPEGLTVMGLNALYVAEGSAVEGLTDSMASTSYFVDGIAYATGYMPAGGSLKVSDLRVPAFNGTVASSWTHTVDGKEVAVGDILVGAADEVHATLCKILVQAGEGFAKVFIDKAEVPVGGESVSLSPGTHTVSWTLTDGHVGDGVAVAFAGNAVSGGSFTVGDEDGGAVLELTCAEPADDGKDPSWSTNAAVLVMIVMLAAALVGYRAMKPRF